jgi:N-acetylglucosamine-6-phosphate deacetylase
VLGDSRLYAGIIADGIHVGAHALNISVRSAKDRLCIVTDAMMTLAGESQGFELDRRPIRLREGRLTDADGTLAGAHIAMDESLQKLMELTELALSEALQMASSNPAKALGVDGRFGGIACDLPANLTLLNKDLSTLGTVIGGKISM